MQLDVVYKVKNCGIPGVEDTTRWKECIVIKEPIETYTGLVGLVRMLDDSNCNYFAADYELEEVE
jgi:hypothetical protein